eukprot:766112-Hanusia_phi.AAC.1
MEEELVEEREFCPDELEGAGGEAAVALRMVSSASMERLRRETEGTELNRKRHVHLRHGSEVVAKRVDRARDHRPALVGCAVDDGHFLADNTAVRVIFLVRLPDYDRRSVLDKARAGALV